MTNYDFDTVDKLHEWEVDFLSGDHASDQWAVDVLAFGNDEDGVPLFFHAPRSLTALQFLNANGVDLVRPDADGQTLLWQDRVELDAFAWLADVFKSRRAIDLPDSEGMTALSALIKQGEIPKARLLLERGASPNSFATIARYGGSRLDIATQAIYAQGAPLDLTQEDAAIAALSLLKEFGLATSPEQKRDLAARAESKPRLLGWISANM
jgi:ankyrin repeat protein